MTVLSSDNPILHWFRSKPHAQPLLWLSVLMLAQLLAVNFYLGLWRYGETGFQTSITTTFTASIAVIWAAFGARGWLRQSDPADTLLCLVSILVLLFTFPPLKSVIPLIMPYQHDALFTAIDQTLHFGHPPHEYLAFLYQPAMLWIMTSIYYIYFLICCLVACAAAFLPPHARDREAFLITFIASWYINGMVLAVIMSSVGPIYLDVFYDGALVAPYEAAIQNVCSLSSLTCEIRTLLLDMYLYGDFFDLNTPSAMPSIHITATFTLALYAQHSFKKLAPYAWIFFAVILLSSVALLWHYAIDGYVAMLTTWIIWRLSLKWVARHNSAHQQTDDIAALNDDQTAAQQHPDRG